MSNIQTQTQIFRLESALAKADDEITALRAELEQARLREACAADLAREWEQHCKTAEAEVERLRAALIHARNQMQHPDQLIDEALAQTAPPKETT